MKISKDEYDPLDDITIKICNLVRNMIYSAYKEGNYNKAILNGNQLLQIVSEELQEYTKAIEFLNKK